jgi:hypothetical protein
VVVDNGAIIRRAFVKKPHEIIMNQIMVKNDTPGINSRFVKGFTKVFKGQVGED